MSINNGTVLSYAVIIDYFCIQCTIHNNIIEEVFLTFIYSFFILFHRILYIR